MSSTQNSARPWPTWRSSRRSRTVIRWHSSRNSSAGTPTRSNCGFLTPSLRTCCCGPRPVSTLLVLSEGTVRNYLSAAMAKVGARNRAEAVRIADERGWL